VSLLLENLDAPASQARLDVPVSQARLVPEPLDVGSLVQAHKIGTDVDGSSLGAIVLSKLDCSPAIQKAFSLPWEEDLLTSPVGGGFWVWGGSHCQSIGVGGLLGQGCS
jgi:hypothetical protein